MEAIPYHSPVAIYHEQIAYLYQLAQVREKKVLQFLVGYLPRLQPRGEEVLEHLIFTQQDVEEAILNWYHFKSWSELSDFTNAVSEQETVVQFEQAVDAIIAGDIVTLSLLLKKNPPLIHERSLRWHRSTLLHYIGANGVEDFRQQSPPNSPAVL